MWYIWGLNLVILLNFSGTCVTASSRITERKKYFIGTDEVSGIQAVEMCRRKSMKLATISNEKENNDVYRFLQNKDVGIGLYISAKKLSYGEAFAWLDGQPIDYSNWNAGEPNGYIESESCVYVFSFKNDLKWDDIPCERTFFYLCEYEEEKECVIAHDDDSCEHSESRKQRYYFGTKMMTYYHAIQYCENMFMELARIRNAEENAEIYKLLLVRGNIPGEAFWLAANRRLGSNNWQWLDGKILTYFNWDEGEPNNQGELGIVVYKRNKKTVWMDSPCGSMFYPLCEKVDPGVEIYVNKKLVTKRNQRVYPHPSDTLEIYLDLPPSNYSMRWNVVRR